MLATFLVDSTAASGPGSLDDAVNLANATEEADDITFAPQLSGATIVLGSELDIFEDLTIDATTLPDGLTIDGDLDTRLIDVQESVTAELSGLTFVRGRDSGVGAVLNRGTLSINQSTFSENEDAPIWNSGTLTVSQSYIHGVANVSIPAILNSGHATIVDSTIVTDSRSPTIITSSNGNRSLTIERTTIAGGPENAMLSGEVFAISDNIFNGQINQFTPRVVINNSIVTGAIDAAVDANYSLLEDIFPEYVIGTGNHLNLNPQLGPLADNGGATPTFALLPGSPALNGGDPNFVPDAGATDQRGGPYARVVGQLDMGAYEAQAVPTGTPGDFNSDGRVDAADSTLWRDNLGATGAPLIVGDATGDGVVDSADYATWRDHYGFVPLGDQLVVNDLGNIDDGEIFNGRTTLREAINYANVTNWIDTITFDASLSGGVISVEQVFGASYLQIRDAVTIDARMLPEGITIDAGNFASAIHINNSFDQFNNDFDVTLAGLTLTNGRGQFGGGGAINSLSTGKVTVIDSHLLDNHGGNGNGGAIYSRGSVELIDTLIDGATTPNLGSSQPRAAVWAYGGGVSLTGSTIQNVGGVAGHDFGIYSVGSMVTLTDSVISDAKGGIASRGDVMLTRSRIEDNVGAGFDGGGIQAWQLSHLPDSPGGNVTLVDSVVSGNTSQLGTRHRFTSDIDSNDFGGAGIVAEGDVTLTRSTVTNNRVLDDAHDTLGGGILAKGRVTATDSAINDNYAGRGGGIYVVGIDAHGEMPVAESMVVTLVGTAVNNNTSHDGGAAIHALGSISIDTSSVSDNEVTTDFFDFNDPTAIVLIEAPTRFYTAIVTDSVLANNGANILTTRVIDTSQPIEIEIVRSDVIDNQMYGVTATRVVDSVVARNTGTGVLGFHIEILGSTISGNLSGGIDANTFPGSTVTLQDSIVRGNTVTLTGSAQFAAGITTNTLISQRSTIADNHLIIAHSFPFNGTMGGGVRAGNIAVIESTVRDNTIIGDGAAGGGINASGGFIYGSTISGNAAIGENAKGGGLSLRRSFTIEQSTISGNRVEGAGAQGGGLWAEELRATHITVAGNSALGTDAEGGGVFTDDADVVGSVLAGNMAPNAPDLRAMDVHPDDPPNENEPGVAYSLVSNSAGSFLASGAGGVGNLLDVDAMLGPLADNGGPTLTHLPLDGSPLIDAGDPALLTLPLQINHPLIMVDIPGIYDQRGEPFDRVIDGGSGTVRIDIGAVEFEPPVVPLAVGFGGTLTDAKESDQGSLLAGEQALVELADDGLLLLLDSEAIVADHLAEDLTSQADRDANGRASMFGDLAMLEAELAEGIE